MKISVLRIDDEYEVDAVLNPGDPGRDCGPPDLRYPPTPDEIEIFSCKKNGVDLHPDDLPDEILDVVQSILYAESKGSDESEEPDYYE